MLDKAERKGPIAFLIVGALLFALLVVSFVPLFPCRTCSWERHNFEDWLTDPSVRGYREKHPEEVSEVKEKLRRIEERCPRCSRGKITVWDRLNWLTR